MEFRLLFAALIAMGVAAVALRRLPLGGSDGVGSDEIQEPGATGDRTRLWDVALAAVLAGVLTGRIAAMLAGGVNPLVNPLDILAIRGGVATGWATLGALVTGAWLGRPRPAAALDGLAVAAVLSLAAWHGTCLLRDRCAGVTGDVPWAITRSGSSAGRHPVELYAALALAVAGAGLAWWSGRRPRIPAGVVAGTALGIAGAVRLGTEPYRLSLGGGPWLWYLGGVVAGIALLVTALLVDHRGRRKGVAHIERSDADPLDGGALGDVTGDPPTDTSEGGQRR